MPLLWRKPNGVRDVATETSFMPALAPVSVQESFLTAASIMEERVPLRKVGISESTVTVLFAIAGNAAASKHWQQGPRSPDVPSRNLRGIPSRSWWKWPVEIFRL